MKKKDRIGREAAEVKGLLARKKEDPAYRRRHERSYEALKLEVKNLLAAEKKEDKRLH